MPLFWVVEERRRVLVEVAGLYIQADDEDDAREKYLEQYADLDWEWVRTIDSQSNGPYVREATNDETTLG